MFATLSTAWVLPGVLGPALAGVVGELFGWRYVFLGLLPLIAAAGLLTIRALAAVPATDAAHAAEAAAVTAERRRLPNALLVAAGAGLITVGLTVGQAGATAGLVLVGLLLGLPAIRRLTPEGTLTARPILPAAVLLRGVLTFMFFGVDAYVSLTLEEYRGLSAVLAGVVLTAATVAWTAGSWIQARNAERWPTAWFVTAGFLVALVGLATFCVILVPEVPVAWAVPTFAIVGLGMGLAYAPLSLIVLREAGPGTQGTASSALSLSDTLGTAMGTGVSGAIIAAGLRATGEHQTGLAVAFAVAIAVGIGGLVLTGRLRRAVPTMQAAPVATPASPTGS